MFTLKRLYGEVVVTKAREVDDSLPVHVFTAAENASGTVSCNVEAKLVVLNLSVGESSRQSLELADVALAEMAGLDTGTLVYDVRHGPGLEGSPADLEIRTRLLKSGALNHLAILSHSAGSKAEPSALQDLVDLAKVDVVRSTTFGELIRTLSSRNPVLALECSVSARHKDFSASYAGSVFSVPELKTTVVRMSGNGSQPACIKEMFRAAVMLHLKHRASTLILDTSDSPTVTGSGGSSEFNDAVIAPLASLGQASTLVHVRMEEIGQIQERASLAKACDEWGVFECEASTLGEALATVRALEGRFATPAPILPVLR